MSWISITNVTLHPSSPFQDAVSNKNAACYFTPGRYIKIGTVDSLFSDFTDDAVKSKDIVDSLVGHTILTKITLNNSIVITSLFDYNLGCIFIDFPTNATREASAGSIMDVSCVPSNAGCLVVRSDSRQFQPMTRPKKYRKYGILAIIMWCLGDAFQMSAISNIDICVNPTVEFLSNLRCASSSDSFMLRLSKSITRLSF